MESECLPFSRILHTSRLFDDYLHNFECVKAFYARSPLDGTWWDQERALINYPDERRKRMAAILERQNRAFGAGEKTFKNIQRLRDGAPAVVTGQQVGLLGGPVFCLLKALTVAILAEKHDAVPVFWLASEDHDFEEVNWVNLPAGDHLKKFSVNMPHQEGAPVGSIAFDDEITAAVKQVEELFGNSEVVEALANSYKKGENFGSAFAKFYARALEPLGIVFLNSFDREVHAIAQPVFTAALSRASEINQALLARNEELEKAGYEAQVKVTASHTLCFYFADSVRTPIRTGGDDFLIGDRKVTHAELLRESEQHPERFSGNVLLRPVVQDYLLPTLSYSGGPAEIAYFAQIEVVYRRLAGRVTPVMPRIFATLVEPRQAKLLDRYELQLPDVFVGGEKLREVVAARALPESISRSFDEAAEHLEKAVQLLQGPLEKLDKTLVDAAANAASKMRHQLQSLSEKAARAEARKNSELQRHADELSTLLYPNKELQEREIGAVYFLLKYGTGLVERLKQSLQQGCLEHQVVRVGPGA